TTVFGEEIKTVMHEPQLFHDLKPVPDAIETFERLYKSNLFEMYIVTAAHPRSVEAKYEWIKKYMPYFPESNIIVSSAKFMIRGDYLLDDGMHNIKAFAEVGGKSIVFKRPHNERESELYQSISSWKEFEKFIINECYEELEYSYFEQELADEKVV
ncbi:MAG: 5' nucleotidase, NT5C type, partial [Cellulosilyticaceae bacterium]